MAFSSSFEAVLTELAFIALILAFRLSYWILSAGVNDLGSRSSHIARFQFMTRKTHKLTLI